MADGEEKYVYNWTDYDYNDTYWWEWLISDYNTFHTFELIMADLNFIMLIVGCIGNVFAIIVLARTQRTYSSTAIFLTALAVSDCIILLVNALCIWMGTRFYLYFDEIHTVTCKLYWFLVYWSVESSSWLLVALTVMRVMQIRTTESADIFKPVHAKITVGVTWFVLAGVNSIFFVSENLEVFDFKFKENNMTISDPFKICSPLYDSKLVSDYYDAIPYLDFVLTFAVPFVVIALGNSFIIYRLTRYRNLRKQVKEESNNDKEATNVRIGRSDAFRTAAQEKAKLNGLNEQSDVNLVNERTVKANGNSNNFKRQTEYNANASIVKLKSNVNGAVLPAEGNAGETTTPTQCNIDAAQTSDDEDGASKNAQSDVDGTDINKPAELRLARILVIVSVVFLVTMGPVSVFKIVSDPWLNDIYTNAELQTFLFLMVISATLANVNALLNFYLYFLSSPKFRRDAKSVLCGCFCRKIVDKNGDETSAATAGNVGMSTTNF